MGKLVDMTGNRIGRLIVIGRAGSGTNKKATWLCLCDCGNEKVIEGCDLRSGRVNSCGCLRKELLKEKRSTHGMSGSRFYRIWAEMNKRCTNEKYKQFHDYGGRGIKVCSRWGSFENFRDDLYESYLKHVKDYGEMDTSIDRIDVNGHYAPNNCRWATKSEQNKNQRVRSTSKSKIPGITFHKQTGKWQVRLLVGGKRIHVGLFVKLDDAILAKESTEKSYESEAV